MERCTVIVTAQDRFSTTIRCLTMLFQHTPEPCDVIAVMGGAPKHLRREWSQRFGERVRFLFPSEFVNQATARNIALRQTTTRLAVTMDNDVFVRPGWLASLLQCQHDTGAIMVVPLVLETERRIHTAGNRLFVSYDQGKAFGHKELPFHGMPVGERINLQREPTDYGELHCQLVEVEPALRLGVFDEHIQEVGEVDFGLTCRKAGRAMWFEPASVVRYALRIPLQPDDLRLFAWRWNMAAIWQGYQYFERKWQMDITESGEFRDFLLWYNAQLGLLPRLFPSALALAVDRRLARLRGVVARGLKWMQAPNVLLRRYKAWRIGYYVWPAPRVD